MRFYLAVGLVVAILLAVMPLAVPRSGVSQGSGAGTVSQGDGWLSVLEQQTEEPAGQESGQAPAEEDAQEEQAVFSIFDRSTGQVAQVPVREFLRGAVCAEMPPTFHPEALKAQAVCAHTWACYQQRLQQNAPDPALLGADFSADPQNWEGYVTEDQAKERFGEHFEEYWGAITQAADAVAAQILTDGGEPIPAAYHAISAGATESAENVWGNAVDCLTPVDSAWDEMAPGYSETVTFTADKLRQAIPALEGQGDPSGWFSIEERSDSGYVTAMTVGEEEWTGLEFREALGLRSSALDIAWEGESCTITTRGYGHGVGLSQYGADYLGRQGTGWQEILRHYYPGAELQAAS